MRQFKFGSALLMALILIGCGGSGSDIPAKPKFTAQVSFGDSLSDVGTYNVGEVLTAGGGQFSINGPNANGKAANGNNIINWTEVMAMNLGLPAPCAAWTGMNDGVSGTTLTPTNVPPGPPHPGCTGYAQGGARVTAPNGIHNYLNNPYGPTLGGHELTYPVKDQITQYLTDHGGKFSGNEIVYVFAGSNDLAYQLSLVVGGLTTPTAAGTAMATAANDLADYVNTIIIAGAKYVVVPNIGDFASVPATASYSQGLKDTVITPMISAFNSALQARLAGNANVIYLDFYASSKDQIANPAKYGLTNVTSQACDPVLTPNDRALYCSTSTLKTVNGVQLTADNHYLFADDRHPTPYGYALIAQGVLQAMTAKGWY